MCTEPSLRCSERLTAVCQCLQSGCWSGCGRLEVTRRTLASPVWPFYPPRPGLKAYPELLSHDHGPPIPTTPCSPSPWIVRFCWWTWASSPHSCLPIPVSSTLSHVPQSLPCPMASEQGPSSAHRSALLPSGDRLRFWAPSPRLRSLPTPFPACPGSAVRSSPMLRDRSLERFHG